MKKQEYFEIYDEVINKTSHKMSGVLKFVVCLLYEKNI